MYLLEPLKAGCLLSRKIRESVNYPGISIAREKSKVSWESGNTSILSRKIVVTLSVDK